MKHNFAAFCLLGCTLFNLVACISVVVEAITVAPVGWINARPANASQIIRLSIGIESDGHAGFERTLHEISDPSHERYGKHLSQDEAVNLIRPRLESSIVVQKWLKAAGVSKSRIRDRGQFIDVSVEVADAERLLSARFSIFARDGQEVIGALSYSVPIEVKSHITTIQPTTFFETPVFNYRTRSSGTNVDVKKQVHSNSTQYECQDLNTPECLRKLYRMDPASGDHPSPRSLLGVVGFSKASDHSPDYTVQVVLT